jgi:hypothetical protein
MINKSATILLGVGLSCCLAGVTAQVPAAEGVKPIAAVPKAAKENPLLLSNDAPTIYTVVKGDTLWDISGKFLKEPWRWPEIWNMNRDQIKNPHLIYPGDVVKLSFDASGKPMLSIVSGGASAGDTTAKLSPRIRSQLLGQAIPSIPARAIGPFLTAPLVTDEGALKNAPRIVASEDNRVVVGAGNTVYAIGLRLEQGIRWQVYRPGKQLVDPVTKEALGTEAMYLGDAKVVRFGATPADASTIEIISSTQEINRGDRLTPAGEPTLPQYSPRAPDKQVKGAIVSVMGGVSETAQYSIVVLNMGKREGIEVGHVLSAQQGGETVQTSTGEDQGRGWWPKSMLPKSWRTGPDGLPLEINLPTERNGLLVVFRVFDRVSYALVMSSKRALKVGDVVQTP